MPSAIGVGAGGVVAAGSGIGAMAGVDGTDGAGCATVVFGFVLGVCAARGGDAVVHAGMSMSGKTNARRRANIRRGYHQGRMSGYVFAAPAMFVKERLVCGVGACILRGHS